MKMIYSRKSGILVLKFKNLICLNIKEILNHAPAIIFNFLKIHFYTFLTTVLYIYKDEMILKKLFNLRKNIYIFSHV